MTINRINRIGAPACSMQSHGGDKQESLQTTRSELVNDAPQLRARAGLQIEYPRSRPHANFLAQYIDQHIRWPRAPHRKDHQRQRATRAYIDADMLPDILANALRLRPVDKKV
jgi:hypothetical protein